MLRRKLIAAIAALTAAGAIAIPAASASAHPMPVAYAPPPAFCAALASQIRFATATGNLVLASALSNVLVYSGCGGAAI